MESRYKTYISAILAVLFSASAGIDAAAVRDSIITGKKSTETDSLKTAGTEVRDMGQERSKSLKPAIDSVQALFDRDYDKVYLDTVDLKKKLLINDYSMVGFHYGVGMNRMMFNPEKKQETLFTPLNVGITFTKYGKMFGYMPYFGYQVGIFYGQDGYLFSKDKTTGTSPSVDGAIKAVYDFVEVPALAHMHFDIWRIKLMANIGLFAGYRLKVQRTDDGTGAFDPAYTDKFYDYDVRFDYGIKGGAGFGIMLDPIEIHFNAMYKYSMSSLYKPDYYSEYYYRFAYPSDMVFSVGIHFQLTKRYGKTRGQLRREALEMVKEKYIQPVNGSQNGTIFR